MLNIFYFSDSVSETVYLYRSCIIIISRNISLQLLLFEANTKITRSRQFVSWVIIFKYVDILWRRKTDLSLVSIWIRLKKFFCYNLKVLACGIVKKDRKYYYLPYQVHIKNVIFIWIFIASHLLQSNSYKNLFFEKPLYRNAKSEPKYQQCTDRL